MRADSSLHVHYCVQTEAGGKRKDKEGRHEFAHWRVRMMRTREGEWYIVRVREALLTMAWGHRFIWCSQAEPCRIEEKRKQRGRREMAGGAEGGGGNGWVGVADGEGVKGRRKRMWNCESVNGMTNRTKTAVRPAPRRWQRWHRWAVLPTVYLCIITSGHMQQNTPIGRLSHSLRPSSDMLTWHEFSRSIQHLCRL